MTKPNPPTQDRERSPLGRLRRTIYRFARGFQHFGDLTPPKPVLDPVVAAEPTPPPAEPEGDTTEYLLGRIVYRAVRSLGWPDEKGPGKSEEVPGPKPAVLMPPFKPWPDEEPKLGKPLVGTFGGVPIVCMDVTHDGARGSIVLHGIAMTDELAAVLTEEQAGGNPILLLQGDTEDSPRVHRAIHSVRSIGDMPYVAHGQHLHFMISGEPLTPLDHEAQKAAAAAAKKARVAISVDAPVKPADRIQSARFIIGTTFVIPFWAKRIVPETQEAPTRWVMTMIGGIDAKSPEGRALRATIDERIVGRFECDDFTIEAARLELGQITQEKATTEGTLGADVDTAPKERIEQINVHALAAEEKTHAGVHASVAGAPVPLAAKAPPAPKALTGTFSGVPIACDAFEDDDPEGRPTAMVLRGVAMTAELEKVLRGAATLGSTQVLALSKGDHPAAAKLRRWVALGRWSASEGVIHFGIDGPDKTIHATFTMGPGKELALWCREVRPAPSFGWFLKLAGRGIVEGTPAHDALTAITTGKLVGTFEGGEDRRCENMTLSSTSGERRSAGPNRITGLVVMPVAPPVTHPSFAGIPLAYDTMHGMGLQMYGLGQGLLLTDVEITPALVEAFQAQRTGLLQTKGGPYGSAIIVACHGDRRSVLFELNPDPKVLRPARYKIGGWRAMGSIAAAICRDQLEHGDHAAVLLADQPEAPAAKLPPVLGPKPTDLPAVGTVFALKPNGAQYKLTERTAARTLLVSTTEPSFWFEFAPDWRPAPGMWQVDPAPAATSKLTPDEFRMKFAREINGFFGKPAVEVSLAELMVYAHAGNLAQWLNMEPASPPAETFHAPCPAKAFNFHPDPIRFLAESGLLFAINREVLGPLGLMLVHGEENEPGPVKLIGLADARHDPEGIDCTLDYFAIGAARLEQYLRERGRDALAKRAQRLGHTIQPGTRSIWDWKNDPGPSVAAHKPREGQPLHLGDEAARLAREIRETQARARGRGIDPPDAPRKALAAATLRPRAPAPLIIVADIIEKMTPWHEQLAARLDPTKNSDDGWQNMLGRLADACSVHVLGGIGHARLARMSTRLGSDLTDSERFAARFIALQIAADVICVRFGAEFGDRHAAAARLLARKIDVHTFFQPTT